jgi:carboxymethylenebutenolidase
MAVLIAINNNLHMINRSYFLLASMLITFRTSGQNTNNRPCIGTKKMSYSGKPAAIRGSFVMIKGTNGISYNVYRAGPKDANVGILFIHDYFGISEATKKSVDSLGALGYLTIAADLYKGKSAMNNDEATALMQAKNSAETDLILRANIDYLKKPGRKLASIGFSAGGIDALKATLMEPDLFSATIIVYGGNYEKIEKSSLDKLKTPILAIMGTLDNWAVQSALSFFATEKDKSFEMYFYPGADHGYAQPLFNGGKNYNPEATHVTWMLMKDFLSRNLKNKT